MARTTAFRWALDPTPDQVAVLARHAGARRFAWNQALRLVKDALDARRTDPAVRVPWTRFDLVKAINAWKVSPAAGRTFAVAADGTAEVIAAGLSWRSEVSAQVFEEAAVDLAKALAGFAESKAGRRAGHRIGFPRFGWWPRGAPASCRPPSPAPGTVGT